MGVFCLWFFWGDGGGGESGDPESFPQILGFLWNVGGFWADGSLPGSGKRVLAG